MKESSLPACHAYSWWLGSLLGPWSHETHLSLLIYPAEDLHHWQANIVLRSYRRAFLKHNVCQSWRNINNVLENYIDMSCEMCWKIPPKNTQATLIVGMWIKALLVGYWEAEGKVEKQQLHWHVLAQGVNYFNSDVLRMRLAACHWHD